MPKAASKSPKRRPAARKTAAAAAPATSPRSAKSVLRAGLKALNDVRDEVLTRQSRVFEALLGIEPAAAGGGRSASDWKLLNAGDADAANMQKFEEIFDQRVARSLERLGVPSPQALAALCRQLEAINEHLKRIEPAPPAKRPARRRPARA